MHPFVQVSPKVLVDMDIFIVATSGEIPSSPAKTYSEPAYRTSDVEKLLLLFSLRWLSGKLQFSVDVPDFVVRSGAASSCSEIQVASPFPGSLLHKASLPPSPLQNNDARRHLRFYRPQQQQQTPLRCKHSSGSVLKNAWRSSLIDKPRYNYNIIVRYI